MTSCLPVSISGDMFTDSKAIRFASWKRVYRKLVLNMRHVLSSDIIVDRFMR